MKNIFETAREDDRLSTSVRMADAGGVTEFLQKRGPYTVFIPTDEAYTRIPEEKLEAIVSDRERLAGMVIPCGPGKLTTHELAQMEAKTLQGTTLILQRHLKGCS